MSWYNCFEYTVRFQLHTLKETMLLAYKSTPPSMHEEKNLKHCLDKDRWSAMSFCVILYYCEGENLGGFCWFSLRVIVNFKLRVIASVAYNYKLFTVGNTVITTLDVMCYVSIKLYKSFTYYFLCAVFTLQMAAKSS